MIKNIFFFFFFAVQIFAADVEIKSLKAYKTGNPIALPINEITIEFDIKTEETPNLNIVFRFCNKNWQPYESVFLTNYGKNTARQLSFTNLPVSISEADYHFKDSYPNKDISFPFLGKWKFFVTDAFDTSIVYAEGKFFVLEDLIPLYPKITKDRIDSDFSLPINMNKTFRITTSFLLDDFFYPSQVEEVQIIENWKLDYPIVIDKEKENRQLRYYEWNGNKEFAFIARDVRPGMNTGKRIFLITKFLSVRMLRLREISLRFPAFIILEISI